MVDLHTNGFASEICPNSKTALTSLFAYNTSCNPVSLSFGGLDSACINVGNFLSFAVGFGSPNWPFQPSY